MAKLSKKNSLSIREWFAAYLVICLAVFFFIGIPCAVPKVSDCGIIEKKRKEEVLALCFRQGEYEEARPAIAGGVLSSSLQGIRDRQEVYAKLSVLGSCWVDLSK